MSDRGQGTLARQVRTLFRVGSVAGWTDGQLLDRFARRDAPRELTESAFSALVERHGPMVLRVCRRVLDDPHDAHDAFQGVFLLLARKAWALRDRDSLAAWLHGAALRVASNLRRASARRRAHEQRAAGLTPLEIEGEARDAGELGVVLHEELARLPERLRAPIVLCDLEGLTHAQAAMRLDWPVGTVKSRQARGRDRLRARLARRGFEPDGFLPVPSGPAVLTPSLVTSTVEGALRGSSAGRPFAVQIGLQTLLAFCQGGSTRMLFSHKLTTLAAGLLIVGLGTGGTGDDPSSGKATSATAERGAGKNITFNDRIYEDIETQVDESPEGRLPAAPDPGDPPTEDEILARLPAPKAKDPSFQVKRGNYRLLVEEIADTVDPPRVYPLVGPAQLVHKHFKCTVRFDETTTSDEDPTPFEHVDHRTEVVYIDRDYLILGPDSPLLHKSDRPAKDEPEKPPAACDGSHLPPDLKDYDPPSEQEVWDRVPKFKQGLPVFYDVQRNNARFTIEKIREQVDPGRDYPLAGPCHLVHKHYKCTVHFDEDYWADYPIPFHHRAHRVEVVYIDRDFLVRCPTNERVELDADSDDGDDPVTEPEGSFTSKPKTKLKVRRPRRHGRPPQ